MKTLPELFANNVAWARRKTDSDPLYFARLLNIQRPEYLWIGCSDSRVPANEIVGLAPGELFVHRNVANIVVTTDPNAMAVIEFAIEQLGVRHVIVTGHYGCGGVRAAYDDARFGLIDNWLRHVEDVKRRHEEMLSRLDTERAIDRLCELNVIEQARHVCETTIVQVAWERHHRPVSVHGWIYGLGDGRLRPLGFTASSNGDVERAYRSAVESLGTPLHASTGHP